MIYPTLNRPGFSTKEAQEAWREWLSQWPWDRFVTLTFNRPTVASPLFDAKDADPTFLKDKLKAWDARMNSKILGRSWAKARHHQLFRTYTLEKPRANPHWHGLVQFANASGTEKERQAKLFDDHASSIWAELVPSGDVDVKIIYNREDALKYTSKSLMCMVNYENWVAPDEFTSPNT